mgnify:FL=1
MRDWFSNFREQHLTTYKLTFRIRYWWFTQLCLLGIIVFGKWHLIPYVLAWWFFGAMAITIYAHRGLSHNSIKIKWKWLEHLFCSLCILSNIGSPLAWAVVHRMHHVYLDDEKDPHSPHQIGFLRSLTHRWDVPFENIPLRFTRGLLRLETPKWYHNNSFFPFIFFTIFIWAVTVAYGTSIYGFAELGYYMMNIFSYDGPAVWLQTWGLEFAWAGFAGVALGQWSMGITNAWQHSDKRGKGYIRNVPWYLSFINWGEGSHDYHHSFPRDYSFGKGLNDPTQYFIIFLEKIGALSINRNI